jgi:hypothetical protein
MCVTTTHWSTHISTECAAGGSGQCDGFCATHDGVECTCSCHNAFDLPHTVAAVRDWHDEQENVVASFEGNRFPNGVTDHQTWALVMLPRYQANNEGKSYAVLNGQDRTVIVERY